VTGGPNHAVRSGADDVAKGGEQLQENGFRLGLGVRGQGANGFSGEAIERVLLEYGVAGVLGLGRRFLAEGRLWLWLGFRPERRNRVVGSRAGLVVGKEGSLGEQFVPSLIYVCDGGPFVPGYRRT
jgi:hypothetical protein